MLAVIAASLRGQCPLAMGSRLQTDFPMEWWIRRESNPRHVWFSGPVPRYQRLTRNFAERRPLPDGVLH